MGTIAEVLARIAEEERDQLDFRGLARKNPTKEALAAVARERKARQGHAPLPSGGLWDETAQRQQELF